MIAAGEEEHTDSKRVVWEPGAPARTFTSVGAVGAPVVREEADFGLAGGDDALQAGLLGRVAHVIQHPVEQLADRSTDMSKGYFYLLFTRSVTSNGGQT